MRRSLLGLLVAALFAVPAGTAQTAAQPTVILVPNCTFPRMKVFYGLTVSGQGFPPAEVTFLVTTGALAGLASRTSTDSNGDVEGFGAGLATPLGSSTVLAFADANQNLKLDPGEQLYATATIDNPCAPSHNPQEAGSQTDATKSATPARVRAKPWPV